jgi:extracellular factor (EF) 3-hydroxypalmitic acid methyl ester biosynthesis protein
MVVLSRSFLEPFAKDRVVASNVAVASAVSSPWPDSPIGLLRDRVSRFVGLDTNTEPQSERVFHEVVGSIHLLCAAIAYAEASGVSAAQIRREVEPARSIHARSPLGAHLQRWPRGYMGDFEVIERLMSPCNTAAPGTIEYWIEHYALHSAVAQQHRNKVSRQQELIEQVARASAGATVTAAASASASSSASSSEAASRVLLIACGSAPDLRRVSASTWQSSTFVLNDADEDALAFCSRRMADRLDRITFVPGSVFKRLARLRELGPYDLVLAGGLFDYLPERAASVLIRTVIERLLAPGGRFFFTNINAGNPFRHWIEYLADWMLIERSETDIARLIQESAKDIPCDVEIARDASNLSILATLQRQRQ